MTQHGAYVARIRTRPHGNADRLQIGVVGGFQVVVGLDVQDGELGLFFSSELKLSPEYVEANDLLPRVDPVTGERAGGYFPPSLRVKAQRFRGERSDGYFAPLSSLRFAWMKDPKADPASLVEGDIITHLGDVPICSKYVAPIKAGGGAMKTRKANPFFREHVETEQLGYFVRSIKPGGVAYITLKMHGTSGRTGYVLDERPGEPKWWQRLLRPLAFVLPGDTTVYRLVAEPEPVLEMALLTGTRRVVLGGGKDDGAGYYGSHAFRYAIEERLAGQLAEGEVVYYEICGWVTADQPVMARHDFTGCQDKDLKAWGAGVTYDYGLLPGQCEAYIYRIVQTTIGPMGQPVEVELTWSQVKRRAAHLGLPCVPDLYPATLTGEIAADPDAFVALVNNINDGPDPLDAEHPREGVVVRVENADGSVEFFKSKGLTFKIGEGIAKEAGAEDIEEAQSVEAAA